MKHEEDDQQKALFDWANVAKVAGVKIGEYLFAIPNGGKRNPKEAARMKGMGVKAGVSDVFLPIPMDGYHGLWIEMKANTKCKTSDLQKQWIEKMREKGYAAEVCYGWIDAKCLITSYLMGVHHVDKAGNIN